MKLLCCKRRNNLYSFFNNEPFSKENRSCLKDITLVYVTQERKLSCSFLILSINYSDSNDIEWVCSPSRGYSNKWFHRDLSYCKARSGISIESDMLLWTHIHRPFDPFTSPHLSVTRSELIVRYR